MIKPYCEVITGCYFTEEYLLLEAWYVLSIIGPRGSLARPCFALNICKVVSCLRERSPTAAYVYM